MGPVEIEYHDTVCSAGQCSIPFTKGAEEKSIFLKTSLTAAGDEIGWDFGECVRKTRCSFTAFCNEMARRYQTTNIMAGPFMSTNTYFLVFSAGLQHSRSTFAKSMTHGVRTNLPSLLVMVHTSVYQSEISISEYQSWNQIYLMLP